MTIDHNKFEMIHKKEFPHTCHDVPHPWYASYGYLNKVIWKS